MLLGSKYNDLIPSIENVKYNISSYSEDLVKAKNRFRANATTIAQDVKTQASNIPSV